jgi:hypothetical protein
MAVTGATKMSILKEILFSVLKNVEGLLSQIKGNSINYPTFCSVWGDH